MGYPVEPHKTPKASAWKKVKTPKPTAWKAPKPKKTPKPTKAEKTPKPTAWKTEKPTKAQKTPKPTNKEKTPKPTVWKAEKTPKPTWHKVEKTLKPTVWKSSDYDKTPKHYSMNEKEKADLLEAENESNFGQESSLLGDDNDEDTAGYLDSVSNFYNFGQHGCYLGDGEACNPNPFSFDGHGPNPGCVCRSFCCEGGRCVAKKPDYIGVPYCPSECRGGFLEPTGTC